MQVINHYPGDQGDASSIYDVEFILPKKRRLEFKSSLYSRPNSVTFKSIQYSNALARNKIFRNVFIIAMREAFEDY